MSKPKDRTVVLCCAKAFGKTHVRDEWKAVVPRAVCGEHVCALAYNCSRPVEDAVTCGRCRHWIEEKRRKGAAVTVANYGNGLAKKGETI